MIREQHIIKGQVQGVGFRPFIYKIAIENMLTGFVQNTPKGVVIEVQGNEKNIAQFNLDFYNKLPRLAKISQHDTTKISVKENEQNFAIIHSEQGSHKGHSVLVSPDVAICDDCKHDIFELNNSRFGYAFTNCTNCGPRYTITKSIPYDRPVTTMACFPLCEHCNTEYTNPLDRRFHAQPNACPKCGPHLWLSSGKQSNQTNKDYLPQDQEIIAENTNAIAKSIEFLKNGKILAIKGLGGFQLACDAYNEQAIATLRQRKNRPHKAFAIMVKDIETAKEIAHISKEAEELLCSLQAPIVLCKQKDTKLPKSINPDTQRIGIMLAYSPLHLLLFSNETVNTSCSAPKALIMTSANHGGKPICIQNRQALHDLSSIADYYLFHDRDILIRVDDSVCLPIENAKQLGLPPAVFYRRARGYVPSPIRFPNSLSYHSSVFATGAFLKNTFTLTKENEAYQSQHIGDLENLETVEFFEETAKHLQKLLEVKPTTVCTDLHPDFPSTQLAEEYASTNAISCVKVQHHIAHAYAVLAEQKELSDSPYLALILDGTGLGLDSTIWGSELFYIFPKEKRYYRLASLSPIPLIGGDKANFEPWRIAFALHKKAQDLKYLEKDQVFPLSISEQEKSLCATMLEKNLNCPQSSGAGRLFDAISALLSLCTHTSYEGQAPIILEDYALRSNELYTIKASIHENKNQLQEILLHTKNKTMPTQYNPIWEIDTAHLYAQLYTLAIKSRTHKEEIAKIFHNSIITAYSDLIQKANQHLQSTNLIFSGGVFNNELILKGLHASLKNSFTILLPQHSPVGDASISLGQAFYASIKI